MSFSFHCQSRIFWKSGGQLAMDQFGYWEFSQSPGQPEKPTMVLTPIFSARQIAASNCSW